MKININYPQLVAEFVIVFVGVAVALAADEWRQNLQDQALEETYLIGVLGDLNIGAEQLEERRPTADAAIKNAESLADALSGDSAPISEAEMITKFVISARTGFARAQYEHDSTYRELNSTGRLALISDSLLRQELVNYYRSVDVLIQETDNNPREIFTRQARLTGKFGYYFASDLNLLREGDRKRILQALSTDKLQIAEELRFLSANIIFNEVRADRVLQANATLIEKLKQALK